MEKIWFVSQFNKKFRNFHDEIISCAERSNTTEIRLSMVKRNTSLSVQHWKFFDVYANSKMKTGIVGGMWREPALSRSEKERE